MRIGEVLKDRYQVLAKVGYGTSSTGWLCWFQISSHEKPFVEFEGGGLGSALFGSCTHRVTPDGAYARLRRR